MPNFFDPGVVSRIVSGFGTPCYIYSQQALIKNVIGFRGIEYEPKRIHAATMSNSNPELLRLLHRHGVGVFVNSYWHLQIALGAGIPASDVIYTATGVPRAIMRELVANGIRTNVDSVQQLGLYGQMNPGGKVGLRLNIMEKPRAQAGPPRAQSGGGQGASDEPFHKSESRIGICESELDEVFEIAATYRLVINGVHVYLGTDIIEPAYLIAGVHAALRMSTRLCELEYVDLGGGFPAAGMKIGAFDYATYGRAVTQILDDFARTTGRRLELVLEPGRSLFGDSAVFCTRVTDLKRRSQRLIVGCDASVSLFPRPFFYGEYHDVHVNGKAGHDPMGVSVDIVGNTTYSGDYLARGVALPELALDDILVFQHAGGYCYSMITRFLGQLAPPEILIGHDGEARLIRARESAESVTS
jgi:diaminopimelate decarboxylase